MYYSGQLVAMYRKNILALQERECFKYRFKLNGLKESLLSRQMLTSIFQIFVLKELPYLYEYCMYF